ncbi:ElaA protein [Inhella inkyongensis]|uniref:ElaA protein n=1 Tax=Inhella inkyongensis TaxID=392593 RepID=A0A840S3S1_9BURK|nr:GNAT family N-acetyltransferase [Inhella inkyongensis]MBB5203696.1 ElaA protein [Inhella inkyongensis]
MSELIWDCQAFASLSGAQVYEILRLRSEVFVVEQQCIFQDPDGADDRAWHLGAWQAGGLMAYARLLGPGIKAARPSFGRVITAPAARGQGLGHELVRRALSECERHWPGQGVTIFAQAHLQNYYGAHGFVPVGAPFMEDDILHMEMVKA